MRDETETETFPQFYETETIARHLVFSPRRDRDRDLSTILRDRDDSETLDFLSETIETETETETFFETFWLVVLWLVFNVVCIGSTTMGTEGNWSPNFWIGWDQPCNWSPATLGMFSRHLTKPRWWYSSAVFWNPKTVKKQYDVCTALLRPLCPTRVLCRWCHLFMIFAVFDVLRATCRR